MRRDVGAMAVKRCGKPRERYVESGAEARGKSFQRKPCKCYHMQNPVIKKFLHLTIVVFAAFSTVILSSFDAKRVPSGTDKI